MRKGITLLEVLIVLSILMILGGLLFPVFASAKARAKRQACAAELSQAFHAITLYANDADGIYPAAKDCMDVALPRFQPARIQSFPLLVDAVLPYSHSREIFHCPEDRGSHVSEPQFPEPMEFSPSIFGKCGMSYEYHTGLGAAGVSDTRVQHPERVNVLGDVAGHWHGSTSALTKEDNFDGYREKVPGYRYNVVFVDGHLQVIDRNGVSRAWDSD